MSFRTFLSTVSIAALAATSSATVTFNNFFADSAGTAAGYGGTPTINMNALTYLSGSADVGEFSSSNLLSFTFGYDASTTDVFSATTSLGQTGTSGTGSVSFTQSVFALDSLGNQGALLGTVTASTDSAGNLPFTNLALASKVSNIRVINTYVLSASNSADVDYATIGLVNQSVQAVPEPASFAALGLGVAALARRKRR